MEQNESFYKISDYKIRLCMPCIICGEAVELTKEEEVRLDYGRHVCSKVCNECKSAVLYMRAHMEQQEN
jgi:hypothetical protein